MHLVTGVAGFIGSAVARRLLEEGQRVRGVDALTPQYGTAAKRRNVRALSAHRGFTFQHADLATCSTAGVLEGVSIVHHMAARTGLAGSWGDGFHEFLVSNVTATNRLLDGCLSSDVERVVLASSGSVYGKVPALVASEDTVPRPQSPYGVTKLAAERLAVAYADAFGLPVVPLRLFYVYGPGQRPDVGLYKMIESTLTGRPFELFGDPRQARDMVFVDDVAEAVVRAARCASKTWGEPINIASGQAVQLSTLVDLVGTISGRRVVVVDGPSHPGYVHSTRGTNGLAAEVLDWSPTTSLEVGLAAQIAWQAEPLARDER